MAETISIVFFAIQDLHTVILYSSYIHNIFTLISYCIRIIVSPQFPHENGHGKTRPARPCPSRSEIHRNLWRTLLEKTVDTPKVPTKKMVNKNPYLQYNMTKSAYENCESVEHICMQTLNTNSAYEIINCDNYRLTIHICILGNHEGLVASNFKIF